MYQVPKLTSEGIVMILLACAVILSSNLWTYRVVFLWGGGGERRGHSPSPYFQYLVFGFAFCAGDGNFPLALTPW